MVARVGGGLVEPLWRPVRRCNRSDLSAIDDPRDRFEDLAHGLGRVVAMEHPEVDDIEAETLEARVEIGLEGVERQTGDAVVRMAALGDDRRASGCGPALAQPPTDGLLAEPATVVLGGVDGVAAPFDERVEDPGGLVEPLGLEPRAPEDDSR